MGQEISFPTSNPFNDPTFLSTFKIPSRWQPTFETKSYPSPSIFATLRRARIPKPNDFIPLFGDCISVASTRTQEFLVFKDPENKFHPGSEVLTQIFLMTYITQSVSLNLINNFTCTAMTPEQRILLGADWVWALLDKPSKTPKIQIAVQVLHLHEREEAEDHTCGQETYRESMQMAQRASSNRNMHEKMVDFCTSIGKDCYALFLFFGKKNDRENIYGVLSNNFEAANGKYHRFDRTLIENFFRGSRYLHTPSGMMHAIISKRRGDPLTLMIKFS
uniref:Rab15 effector protein n=1 Tax=Gouania willdenowi TaxID=441366 RepID=A0A8C5EIJ1_GOUWI